MKALIRGKEVYPEDQWSLFTRNHLTWMTGTETDSEGNVLPGDGWTLVENYVPATETTEASYDVVETEDVTVTDDTVIIDGKEYTKEELRALLGE